MKRFGLLVLIWGACASACGAPNQDFEQIAQTMAEGEKCATATLQVYHKESFYDFSERYTLLSCKCLGTGEGPLEGLYLTRLNKDCSTNQITRSCFIFRNDAWQDFECHIAIECLPGDLPPNIEVNLAELTFIDDAVLVRDLKLSDAIKVLSEPEEIIVKILPLEEEEIEEVVEEEVPEVELVGEEEKPKPEVEAEAEEEAPSQE